MRKPWTPGTPCPKCETPIWAESDKYKPGRCICNSCGILERRKQQQAARKRAARPCRVCKQPLVGQDTRFVICKPCRVAQAAEANAARRCPCGASIAHRSKNARFCEKCSVRQKAKGATAGSAAATEKRRKAWKEQRPAEIAPRPAAQAWAGLRGPGGEWEQGPTTVQGWATLDGGRL